MRGIRWSIPRRATPPSKGRVLTVIPVMGILLLLLGGAVRHPCRRAGIRRLFGRRRCNVYFWCSRLAISHFCTWLNLAIIGRIPIIIMAIVITNRRGMRFAMGRDGGPRPGRTVRSSFRSMGSMRRRMMMMTVLPPSAIIIQVPVMGTKTKIPNKTLLPIHS